MHLSCTKYPFDSIYTQIYAIYDNVVLVYNISDVLHTYIHTYILLTKYTLKGSDHNKYNIIDEDPPCVELERLHKVQPIS